MQEKDPVEDPVNFPAFPVYELVRTVEWVV